MSEPIIIPEIIRAAPEPTREGEAPAEPARQEPRPPAACPPAACPPAACPPAACPPAACPPAACPADQAKSSRRRGVVLVAVLIVVASLSLAAYHYSDMMVSEYKASENAHRAVQARANAASGIYYAAAMLSNPDNFNNILNGNPYNNPTAFQGIAVNGDGAMQGRFSIVAPPSLDDPDLTTCYYGVSDECGKLNPNALMILDPTGQKLHDMLMLLPNMIDDIAWSIVSWMGGSAGVTNSGAGNDYYMALSPPYRCKNAPIDSIDELLLVRGVTRDLLYGTDFNRNGVQDNNNEIGPNGFDRGWSAYLTVHSREPNSDPWTGQSYIYLNVVLMATDDTAAKALYAALIAGGIDDDMAKFVVMYRQYKSSPGAVMPVGVPLPKGAGTVVQGTISEWTIPARSGSALKSIYELIGTQVAITTTSGSGKNAKQVITVYASPLNDPAKLIDQFPKLFAIATLTDPTVTPELIPRINILTAPRAVLLTLPGLASTDVDNIIMARPMLSSTDPPDPSFASPIWLSTAAKIGLPTLLALEPYITTRSQVFRVQSVGYVDGKGPSVRLEAIIDTNAGRPRILAWRDLSEFGKGWNDTPLPAAGP